MEPLLSVRNLKTYFYRRGTVIKAVDGVDFEIAPKGVLALIGESGCGKSVTALSLTRLVSANGRIVSGEIIFKGDDILKADRKKLEGIRGGEISYIFQDPATSFNPVFTIGEQIVEAIELHRGLSSHSARDCAAELLKSVEIPAPKERLGSYPHELSGGMKQRAMLAMAIASHPALLIADEPTTSLDVTIQMQILDLLNKLRQENGLAILLITHDFSVVAHMADEVAVMYLGKIVERASLREILDNPLHPYTVGLLGCIPKPGKPKGRLAFIEGSVAHPDCALLGCNFAQRCNLADDSCGEEMELVEVRPGHWVRCGKAGYRG